MIQMFVDFNCPFCFVQTERLLQLQPEAKIEYRFIEHAPNVISHANTPEQMALLNEEFTLILDRGKDVDVSKPSFCVNTRLAILYYLSILEVHPDKADEFRTSVYRCYWQQNLDISKPEVIAQVLKQLGCDDLQISESAINRFRETQNYWLNGDLEQRIPALRSDKNGLLLGLQHIETVSAYIEGNHCLEHRQGEVCKPDQQQKIALIDLAPLAKILIDSSALYQVNEFSDVDILLSSQALPDYRAILFRVTDDEQVWQNLIKLKESGINRYLPLIAITEQHSPKLIKQGYVLGASDVFNLVTVDEYILPCLASRITNYQLLNTLADFAQIDGLTQLWNKRAFLEFAQRKWRQSCRNKTVLSLVMIDIDHFKSYNDLYGHLAGDHCLQQIGRLMREVLQRPDDIAARFGGEEFCLILPQTDLQGTKHIVEIIQSKLQLLAINHQKNCTSGSCVVSLSFGSVSCVAHPDSAFVDILEQADQQLYQAKRAGRNQAKFKALTLA